MTSKQEKKQKNYDKLTSIAESILNPDKIFFDLIQVVSHGKDMYGVKIYIENSGTYIIECDEDNFKYFLRRTKKEILANPYKCPFCGKLDPNNKCSSCKAEFFESTSCSYDNSKLTSYGDFEDFSKKIEEKTIINKEIIKNYCDLDGNLSDILEGVAVVYKGNSKWPIFAISKNIQLKNFNLMDNISFHKLILSYLVKNKNSNIIDLSDSYRKLSSGTEIYNKKYDSNILYFFESENNSQVLKLAITERDISFEYKLEIEEDENDESYIDSNDDYYFDYLIDEMYDFNFYNDLINDDYYFMFNFEFIDNKKLETNDFDTIVIEFENKINSMVDEAFIKSKKAIDNVIKKLESKK